MSTALAGALVLAAGCAAPGHDYAGLGVLPEARLPVPEQLTPESAARIAQRYQRALAVAEGPGVRLDIRWRLADLAMARSEAALAESDSTEAQFEEPIERYRSLLDDYRSNRWHEAGIEPPASPDHLYYQLAKAYALDGHMAQADQTLVELAERFPASPYYAEAQFRRAERAFSLGAYAQAEALYRELLPGVGPVPEFGQNALYMRAWAQFKQGDYADALESFAGVLDHLLRPAEEAAQLDRAWSELGGAQAEVAGDALRAMALSFAYLQGPESIRALQQRIGPRPYEHRLYRRLAETYREQERVRDAAHTYAQYVAQNPNSDLAPEFTLAQIDTYREGRYPTLVRAGQQEFVRRYGLLSAYWFARGGQPGEMVEAALQEFLPGLANFQHARAQRLADEGAGASQVRHAFAQAATWYREFVASFPAHPAVPEQRFLLAEVLNEAGQWPEAYEHYRRVAFDHRDPAYGREAAYAAVLLADALDRDSAPGDDRWWLQRLVVGQQFAEHYRDDPRVTEALGQLAREQLTRGEWTAAAAQAQQVIDWQPPAAADERFSAWLVLGHSQFDLGAYAQAEQAYWRVLDQWPADSGTDAPRPTQAEVRERIAASMYQRARQQLDGGATENAVALLSQIPQTLPNTTVAAQAQFDAAHYLMQLEHWPEAQQALETFRAAYPAHPRQAELPVRLARVHQAQENWQAAADELRRVEQNSDDPELRRESLYLAAELYQRAGEPTEAIDAFRRYAHTYPEPVADRREAAYQLSELYRQSGQTDNRSFWLQRLVDDYQPGDGRAAYLAAFGASELAESSFNAFSAIQLRLPLGPSLERKRAALERALADQEAILDYGVAEFSTRASHRMAAIYHQLSRDLMASERPEGLGVLELEQYDILLEEQAYPFEEKAIELYEINARRTQRGVYDQWVKESFAALAQILPARYGKEEQVAEVSRGIH